MTGPVFKQYSSIENHYRENQLNLIIEGAEKYVTQMMSVDPHSPPLEWVASEKIHGANFSFIVTADNSKTTAPLVSVAKRNSILEKGDKFFPQAVATISKKYTPAAQEAFKVISEQFATEKNALVRQVVIFGELFGGQYMKKISGRGPVQPGVFYCEDFEFYAFDVFVLCENNETENSSSTTWLNFDEAVQLFERVGFHIYAKPLARGELSELLKFETSFNSTIPATFFPHLPVMEPRKNICEGVVIRPANAVIYSVEGDRAMIKKKNPEFSEISAPKPKTVGGGGGASNLFETEEGKLANEQSELYITLERLNGCESKNGSLNRSTVGVLIGALAKDALEDYIKDNQATWNTIGPNDKKKITRNLSELAKKLVLSQLNKAK